MADWKKINAARVREGKLASDDSYGFNGCFKFIINQTYRLKVIASDGDGWQHVSVSFADRPTTPSWEIMCIIKDLFWEPEDVVVQFHPRKSDYVNHHPGCLHLWRCTDGREFPTPPTYMVGPKA